MQRNFTVCNVTLEVILHITAVKFGSSVIIVMFKLLFLHYAYQCQSNAFVESVKLDGKPCYSESSELQENLHN